MVKAKKQTMNNIKLRAFSPVNNEMYYDNDPNYHFKIFSNCIAYTPNDQYEFNLTHFATDIIETNPEFIKVSQFIGLMDKNGKAIYTGDILRCKVIMGNKKEYTSDCYYRVDLNICSGVSLYAIKMASEDKSNQAPIENSPSFKYGSLCTDYRNQKYDKLALEDTWAENQHRGERWQNNNYSNDIEIAGNIYQNQELLK